MPLSTPPNHLRDDPDLLLDGLSRQAAAGEEDSSGAWPTPMGHSLIYRTFRFSRRRIKSPSTARTTARTIAIGHH